MTIRMEARGLVIGINHGRVAQIQMISIKIVNCGAGSNWRWCCAANTGVKVRTMWVSDQTNNNIGSGALDSCRATLGRAAMVTNNNNERLPMDDKRLFNSRRSCIYRRVMSSVLLLTYRMYELILEKNPA